MRTRHPALESSEWHLDRWDSKRNSDSVKETEHESADLVLVTETRQNSDQKSKKKSTGSSAYRVKIPSLKRDRSGLHVRWKEGEDKDLLAICFLDIICVKIPCQSMHKKERATRRTFSCSGRNPQDVIKFCFECH